MSLKSRLLNSASAKVLGYASGILVAGAVFIPGMFKDEPKTDQPQMTAEQMKSFIPTEEQNPQNTITALKANKVPEVVAQAFTPEFNKMASSSTTETKMLNLVAPSQGVSITACYPAKLTKNEQGKPTSYTNLGSITINGVDGSVQTFSEVLQRQPLFKRTAKAEPCGDVKPYNVTNLVMDAAGTVKADTSAAARKPAKPDSKAAAVAKKASAPAQVASHVPYQPSTEALAIQAAKAAGGPPPGAFKFSPDALATELTKTGLAPENAAHFVRTRSPSDGKKVIQQMTQAPFAKLPPVRAFARLNDGAFEAMCVENAKGIAQIFKPAGEFKGQVMWAPSTGPAQLGRIDANYNSSCATWLNAGDNLQVAKVLAKTPSPVTTSKAPTI